MGRQGTSGGALLQHGVLCPTCFTPSSDILSQHPLSQPCRGVAQGKCRQQQAPYCVFNHKCPDCARGSGHREQVCHHAFSSSPAVQPGLLSVQENVKPGIHNSVHSYTLQMQATISLHSSVPVLFFVTPVLKSVQFGIHKRQQVLRKCSLLWKGHCIALVVRGLSKGHANGRLTARAQVLCVACKPCLVEAPPPVGTTILGSWAWLKRGVQQSTHKPPVPHKLSPTWLCCTWCGVHLVLIKHLPPDSAGA